MFDASSLLPVADIISAVQQIERLMVGTMVLVILAATVRFILWAVLSFLIPVPRLAGLVADIITFFAGMMLYASGHGMEALNWAAGLAQSAMPSVAGRLTSLTGLLGPGGF
jgi:hypothetical protein